MSSTILWSEKFATFAAKKERATRSDRQPPYVTTYTNGASGLEPIGNAWSRAHFDGAFYVTPASVERTSCSTVFVESVGGNTVSDDPADLGGGLTDKHLIYEGLSRVAADGVLAGARTIGNGDTLLSVWRPELVALRHALGLPRHPAQVVATRQGLDLSRGLMFNLPDMRVIVLTTPSGRAVMAEALLARPWIRTIVTDTPGELGGALDRMRALGVGRVSCVGGRALAAQLFEAELVDDVYLTTSPRTGGHPNTPLAWDASRFELVTRKEGTANETGVVFQHFHRRERRRV